MKTGIHPEYMECSVRCSCGNQFTTRATKSEMHVELCSQCHPFYTGKQKLVDTGGRVEKFQKRYGDKPVSRKAKAAQVVAEAPAEQAADEATPAE
ncbi:MAG: 50S ribosomal protein L31 [Actinomycetota bacterium]